MHVVSSSYLLSGILNGSSCVTRVVQPVPQVGASPPTRVLTDNSETRPEEQQPAGAAQGSLHPHSLPHPPQPAALQHYQGEGGRFPNPGPCGLPKPGLQQDRHPLPGK